MCVFLTFKLSIVFILKLLNMETILIFNETIEKCKPFYGLPTFGSTTVLKFCKEIPQEICKQFAETLGSH